MIMFFKLHINRILMHIVKYRDSIVSCAKTAGLVKVQFGKLSQTRPGNVHWYMEM